MAKKEWDNHEIQRKMFTIRKAHRPILFNYLQSIILDNPQVLVNGDVSLRLESKKALKKATKGKPDLRKMLVSRECGHCFCTDNYLEQVRTPELVQKFLPVYHSEFEE